MVVVMMNNEIQADPALLEFCQNLPKIELHAHINGSISDETLEKIIQRRGLGLHNQHVWGDMACCFAMFKTLHEVIDNLEDAYTVAHDVIHDFAADGVRYLELRSTPRNVPKTGMTKRAHVETLIKAVKDCQHLNCVTRLLLSVDRGQSLQSAKENVDLAIEYMNSGIVIGLDFSGNPNVNDGADYYSEIRRAKESGLKIALHLCEVPGRNEEASQLLKLVPGRIGHATFLHQELGGSKENEDFVINHKIPMELCPTSNLKTKSIDSYENHHLLFWMRKNHPFLLCTDDKGIFRTTLSEEYAIVMSRLNISHEQIWDMIVDSIEFIFENEEVKCKLRAEFKEIKSLQTCA